MDGTGAVKGSEIVYKSICGKHGLVGGAWWFLVPKARINIIGECVRINRRVMGRISGVVLEKCRDVIDVVINIVHKVIF